MSRSFGLTETSFPDAFTPGARATHGFKSLGTGLYRCAGGGLYYIPASPKEIILSWRFGRSTAVELLQFEISLTHGFWLPLQRRARVGHLGNPLAELAAVDIDNEVWSILLHRGLIDFLDLGSDRADACLIIGNNRLS